MWFVATIGVDLEIWRSFFQLGRYFGLFEDGDIGERFLGISWQWMWCPWVLFVCLQPSCDLRVFGKLADGHAIFFWGRSEWWRPAIGEASAGFGSLMDPSFCPSQTPPFLVGGLEHQFYFPIYWEFHHPNWLSYFSEGWPNHQPESISFNLPENHPHSYVDVDGYDRFHGGPPQS